MKIEKENIIKIHPKFYSKRYIILDFLEFVFVLNLFFNFKQKI